MRFEKKIVGVDNKVKVSSNDTTSGYLEDKIVSANSAIVISTLNDGSNEDLELELDETAIDHDNLTNTHNLTTDIDHDALTNTHNLTTDIDHDALTNTHNLTTDIDHDALTNYVADEHIDWTQSGAGTIDPSNYVDNEYLARDEVAVVWPDGSGSMTLAAALADADVDVIHFMPTQSGLKHVLDNSAGPIAITRPILFHGLGTEGFVDVVGNTIGNDLFAVSGSGSLFSKNISFANCSTVVAHTGAGRVTLQHCEFDGTIGINKVLTTTSASSDIVFQDNVVLFCGSTVLEITDCDTCVIERNNFVLNSAAVIQIDDYTTSCNVSANNFFGGSPQLDINGGSTTATSFLISRSNTYQLPGAGGAININGTAASNFESVGDSAISGTAHIIIDTANLTTYNFRNCAFDDSKITVGSGQIYPQNFVDTVHAAFYANSLRVYYDVDVNSTVTFSQYSNSLGALLQGAGSQVLTLNPSSGAATSTGSITTASGQTGTINLSGTSDGLNFGGITLSGASAITGTIQTSAANSTNLGNITCSGSNNGLISFTGDNNVNVMSVGATGGTVNMDGSGSLARGLVQANGTFTMTGIGNIGGGALLGAGASVTVGGVGSFGNFYVPSGAATVTMSGGGNFGNALVLGTPTITMAGTGQFLNGRMTSTIDMTSAAIGSALLGYHNSSLSTCTISGPGNLVAGSSSPFAYELFTVSGAANLLLFQNEANYGTFTDNTHSVTGNGNCIVIDCDEGNVTASADGCLIVAKVLNSVTLTASADGAHILGFANGSAMTASGIGNGAYGYANGTAIVASGAESCWQFDEGTNATSNSLQIGAAGTGIKIYSSGQIDIPGVLNHDGTTLGFYSVAPVARPAAYTQTYSTTTRTHANPTSSILTDSTGGTANTTCVAISGTGDDANINNNFADIIAQINALRVDLLNAKQVLNSSIDDDQIQGLKQ